MITVTEDEQMRRIQAILTAFPDKVREVYNKGIRAGLNAADKTSMEEVPKTYAIKKANLRDKNVTRRKLKIAADKGVISGEMNYSGYRFPLYRFMVTPNAPRRKGEPMQHVRAKQLIGGNFEPWDNAFIARMKSGHTGVFTRHGKSRFPINERMGASVQEMVSNTVILDEVEAAAYKAVVGGADKQIQRILNGG